MPAPSPPLPAHIASEIALDDLLTQPQPALTSMISSYLSPLLILGAGGKMGPTLAVLARRAADAVGHPLEVIAVSRFHDPVARPWLEQHGVQTLTCDLFDPHALGRLPDSLNLIYLVGLKFGTTQNPALSWATNTLVPARVCERYADSRIVALSTGNVYPNTEIARDGALETDPLIPLGEYANSAVARERIFEFYSRQHRTRIALLRLSYAVELRYGVLADLANRVHQGKPVELANGFFNCIWQGDANDAVLRALPLANTPPSAWNLCRPEIFSVRTVATELAQRMDRPPQFSGRESTTALLTNPTKLWNVLGTPPVTLDPMLDWVADWTRHGGRSLGKPTHFEVRNGNY